jgi:hypothetical protein
LNSITSTVLLQSFPDKLAEATIYFFISLLYDEPEEVPQTNQKPEIGVVT